MNIANLRMFAWGIAVGVLVTPCLMYLSFVYSIHGGFDLPAMVFPYAVVVSPTMGSVTAFSIFLASIQFPLYGMAAGAAASRGRRWLYVWVIILGAAHILVGAVAYHRVISVPLINYP